MNIQPSSRSAFTLIELLVVIAIIGTLAAITSGIASGAQSKARGVECQKNLGDWAKAFGIYVDGNRSHMVPGTGDGSVSDVTAWYNILARQLEEKPLSEYSEDEKLPIPQSGIKSTYICPVADNRENKGIFSYSYNKNLVKNDKRIRAPQVRNASELVVFMDSPNTALYAADESQAASESSQSYRHAHRMNIAFFDGHVASFRQKDLAQGLESPAKVNDSGILWDPWPSDNP